MALTRGPVAALALLAALALPRGPAQAQLAQAQPAPARPAVGAACPGRGAELRVVVEELPDPAPAPAPMAALHEATGRAPGPGVGHHLGVTSSRVEWRSELSARWRRQAVAADPAPVCAVPATVTLRLVRAEHAVRLAEEIPPGGCLWRQVLEHEQRHVAANRLALAEAAAALRPVAAAWAAGAQARAADLDAALAALQTDLRRAVEPELSRMRAATAAAHARIDSPAEYRRLSRVCGPDQVALRTAIRARAAAPAAR